MRVLIASPPFSCGASLVLNMFFELGYRVEFDDVGYWNKDGGRWSLSPEGGAHMSELSLWMSRNRREHYEFDESVTFRVSHRLHQLAHDWDAIVYVARDPIDAIYSHYRRIAPTTGLEASEEKFQEFFERPMFFNHLPYELFISPPLHFGFHAEIFSAVEECPVHVLRLEDLKRGAYGPAINACEALGLSRSKEQIISAIEASQPSQLSSLRDVDGRSRPSGAIPGEWAQRMTRAEHDALLTHPTLAGFCHRHGYLDGVPAGCERQEAPFAILGPVMHNDLGTIEDYGTFPNGLSVDIEKLEDVRRAQACVVIADSVIPERNAKWINLYRTLADLVWSSAEDRSIQRLVDFAALLSGRDITALLMIAARQRFEMNLRTRC